MMGVSVEQSSQRKHTISVTQFQYDVFKKIKKAGNSAIPNDVCEMYPEKSRDEIKSELDELCEKNILSCIDTYVGYMYNIKNSNVILVVDSDEEKKCISGHSKKEKL